MQPCWLAKIFKCFFFLAERVGHVDCTQACWMIWLVGQHASGDLQQVFNLIPLLVWILRQI